MINKIFTKLKRISSTYNITPSFLLFALDSFSIIIGFILSLYFTNSSLLNNSFLEYSSLILVFILLNSLVSINSQYYNSLIRYVGSKYVYKSSLRNFFTTNCVIIFNGFLLKSLIELKTWILIWIFITFMQNILRFLIRDALQFFNISPRNNSQNVVIYGAGKAGIQLYASLNITQNYNVLFFVDDNDKLWGKYIYGKQIKSPNEIRKYKNKVNYILLAIPSLKIRERKYIINSLQKETLKVLQIPSIDEITQGKVPINRLRALSIEDLLEREHFVPDQDLSYPAVKNKVILVTGSGGSIGSEICRQIIRFKPKTLILLDINEHSLYIINKHLQEESNCRIIPLLGNATNYSFLKNIFKKYKVDTVFHAAAYKHVPMVEGNAMQGIYNNVFSTLAICQVAKEKRTDKVVLISSDKAVRPTNIMGASKRLAEQVIQSFAEEEKKTNSKFKTKFLMVRFGNVLGSSGSVVPLFDEQIENGGPLTLTHSEVTRYFMTIKEAASLVVQSTELAKGGDLLLLDMGEPIKILDLAKKMIKLKGLTIKNKQNPNGEIEIIEIGLRPGEKLYEELLIDAETETTIHPRIFRAYEKHLEPSFLYKKLKELESNLNSNNELISLKLLSELVPEWINSKIGTNN